MTRGPVPDARPMLRNPVPPRLSAVAPRVQRRCAHGNKAGDECPKCAAVQRKARDGAPDRRQAPEIEAVLANPGRPLPPAVRQDMEERFAQDFGAVRIHDDATGARAAEAVDAEAFTHGSDIAFAPGRFDPETPAGRELLAHELAHTVQQSRGGQGVQQWGPPSDGALEREADAAASAALAFAPVPPLSAAPAALARKPATGGAKPKGQPKSATPAPTSATIPVDGRNYLVKVDDPRGQKVQGMTEQLVKVTVNKFYLPELKGPRALDVMQKAPPAPLIRVPKDEGSRASLKQEREVTGLLRDNWLRRMRWTEAQADKLWKSCGGDDTFPKVGGVACHMDHIVELQLAGGGNPENIQALDPGPNMESGRLIRAQLADLAIAIANNSELELGGDKRDLQIKMRFETVEACKPAPTVTKCIEIEDKALQTPGDLKIKPGRQYHMLRLRPGEVTFAVEKSLSAPIEGDPDNNALRLAYAGLILTKLDAPDKKNVHALHARIDTETSRLPVKVTAGQKKTDIIYDVSANDEPKLRPLPKTGIPIELDYLSPGKITEVKSENGKFSWTGEINPTVKFLPKLTIAYADQKLWVSAGLSKETLAKKSPIPGARITKASLDIELAPEFKPSGNFGFDFAVGKRTVMDAEVKVFPEDGAIAADGTVQLYIPGVKKASADIKYRKGDWTMTGKVTVADLNLPYLESGELNVSYGKAGFAADGTVNLKLPGGSGTLNLSYARGDWIFKGQGTIGHEKFGTLSVSLRYEDGTFTAVTKGKTKALKLAGLGLTPELEVTFRKKGEEELKYSGTGKVDVAKGKISGALEVTLHETGEFSGKGALTFPVRDDLVVTAEVVMDRKQKVTTTGIVKLTKPIDLFEAKKGLYKLTLFDLTVPIPGLSAGPIGLKFGVAAGLEAGYFFGPAQLKDVVLAGTVKPFEPDPDPIFDLKGTLAISAGAHLGVWVKGKLVVDAGVASATGAIKVGANVQAKGGISAFTVAHYEKGWFEIGATVVANAELNLNCAVVASVELETFLGDYGPGAKWEWEIYSITVPTGLSFEFGAPLSYHSLKGFVLPSPEQVTWKPPQKIDPGDLLKRFLSAARKSGGD